MLQIGGETMLGMATEASGKKAPDAVTDMIRRWLREQERAGKKPAEIARGLGVTRTQIVNVRDGTRGVGTKLEEGFARERFGGSVDALRRAAMGLAPVGTRTIIVDDRYESRPRAAEAARLLGYEEEAIDRVLGMRLDADDDPGSEFWLDMIRTEDRRIKKGVT